jgi:hypothetical protein
LLRVASHRAHRHGALPSALFAVAGAERPVTLLRLRRPATMGG